MSLIARDFRYTLNDQVIGESTADQVLRNRYHIDGAGYTTRTSELLSAQHSVGEQLRQRSFDHLGH